MPCPFIFITCIFLLFVLFVVFFFWCHCATWSLALVILLSLVLYLFYMHLKNWSLNCSRTFFICYRNFPYFCQSASYMNIIAWCSSSSFLSVLLICCWLGSVTLHLSVLPLHGLHIFRILVPVRCILSWLQCIGHGSLVYLETYLGVSSSSSYRLLLCCDYYQCHSYLWCTLVSWSYLVTSCCWVLLQRWGTLFSFWPDSWRQSHIVTSVWQIRCKGCFQVYVRSSLVCSSDTHIPFFMCCMIVS